MKKVLLSLFVVMFLTLLSFQNSSLVSATTWDETEQIIVKKGAFTYDAYLSTDKKECWIHNLEVNPSKGDTSTLKFPTRIKGATVTKLGGALNPSEDSEFEDNIIGVIIEEAHECDGFDNSIKNVKNIIIPNTVTEITYGAFSGFDYVKKISLPDKITELAPSVFYDCDELQEVKLPAKLKKLDTSAFADCDELKTLTIPKSNKNFKFQKGILFSKKGKQLLWVSPTREKITIPSNVTSISDGALTSTYLKKVNISKRNKVFKKHGQSIYTKKDKNLVAVIVKLGLVKISPKVKCIGKVPVSVIGNDIKQVIIPKSVQDVYDSWLFFDSAKVVFKSSTPPVIHSKYEGWEYTCMPIFCEVYVPKNAKTNYMNWAKERDLEFEHLYISK